MKKGDKIQGEKGTYTVVRQLHVTGTHSYFEVSQNGDSFFSKKYTRESRYHADPEVKVLKFLRENPHPHTVPLVDTDWRGLHLIFPYVQSIPLRGLIEKEKLLGVPNLRDIVNTVTSVLKYFHSQEKAYLDVKTDNILMEGHKGIHKQGTKFNVVDGTSYLIDFGTVRPFGRSHEGVLLGSPCSASPEQIKRGSLDHRTDIYGLGATLYELLSGKIPYLSPHGIPSMCNSILSDPVPELQNEKISITTDLSNVICRAMQKKPEDRYQDVTAFCDALMQVI